MSRYLVDRIERSPTIEVHARDARCASCRGATAARGSGGRGQPRAASAHASRRARCSSSSAPCRTRRGWTASVELDDGGYILTGDRAHATTDEDSPTAGVRPLLLETSWPGVFAAGDVRSGSIKRVASAVGEGAMAVRLVHQHLALR